MRFQSPKLVLLLLLLVIAVLGIANTRVADLYFEIKKNFTIFSEVYNEISLRYVDEIEPEPVMRQGIQAMLELLDPYTVLIDESETQEIDIMTTGKYAGIGIEVGSRGGELVVIAPIEGYSAAKRGVKAGDVLIRVNGTDLTGYSPEEVYTLLSGEPNSKVELVVKRFGIEKELSFDLIRERITVKNVPYHTFIDEKAGIGYIYLARFGNGASEEVRAAIVALQEKAPLNGIILDMRNNPGGLLNEAVQIVDKFVPAGIVAVQTRGRLMESNIPYRTMETPLLPETPLVILQNNGSASASEVVAGALQDLDRVVVMGQTSFGKGLVQVIRPLSYNTALKITISKYYTPSGRSIQSLLYKHKGRNQSEKVPDSLRKAFKTKNGRTVYDGAGIEPDIALEEEKMSLLEIALLQKSHYFLFANEYVAKNKSGKLEPIDKVFEQFKSYLKASKFEYESRPEAMLAQLDTGLEGTDIRKRAETNLSALKKLIEAEKQSDFEKASSTIKKELWKELSGRYNDQQSQYAFMVTDDAWVQQATALLKDAKKYQGVLSPKQRK